jgi:mannose-6-phosphate isomerase-like protein (cupin superfamily)
MNQTPEKTQTGATWTAAQTGPLEKLGAYAFAHPLAAKDIEGKLFLKEALGLTGMEVSLNKLPARKFVPWFHKHRENEELYIFLKGRGEFMVDGEVVPVMEGTVIRVAPGGARTWRNNSEEDLYYVVIQAKAGTLPAGTISDGEMLPGRVRWRKAEAEPGS